MKHLRNLSARPQLVVDARGQRLVDNGDRVGIPGPFGNNRVVSALPTNKAGGPVQLVVPVVMHDHTMCYLADPDGTLIGTPGVWVHRLLTARWTQDTRRLAV